MGPTLDESRHWVAQGTEVFLRAGDLDEPESQVCSALPGWTRKHLLAHVAANAEALSNLAHWAATGERTPMYSSADQRIDDIEAGARLPASELTAWVARSAASLDAALDQLTSGQWQSQVMTAQGRTVPASTVPWMRAREVCVHAVDLATGADFGHLEPDFLAALCTDVVAKRSGGPGPALLLVPTDHDGGWELPGDQPPSRVVAPLSDLAAYLTGRGHHLLTTNHDAAPALGPWL